MLLHEVGYEHSFGWPLEKYGGVREEEIAMGCPQVSRDELLRFVSGAEDLSQIYNR